MSPHKCKLIYKTLYIVVEKQLHKVQINKQKLK